MQPTLAFEQDELQYTKFAHCLLHRTELDDCG